VCCSVLQYVIESYVHIHTHIIHEKTTINTHIIHEKTSINAHIIREKTTINTHIIHEKTTIYTHIIHEKTTTKRVCVYIYIGLNYNLRSPGALFQGRCKVCCSVLQCLAVYCSVLQCIEVCCSVAQCVAVCPARIRWWAGLRTIGGWMTGQFSANRALILRDPFSKETLRSNRLRDSTNSRNSHLRRRPTKTALSWINLHLSSWSRLSIDLIERMIESCLTHLHGSYHTCKCVVSQKNSARSSRASWIGGWITPNTLLYMTQQKPFYTQPPILLFRTPVSIHLHQSADESCHTYAGLMSRIWRSHVTHVKESCHTYEKVISHIWRSHVTHVENSRHACLRVVSRIWVGHAHLNESCHVVSHIWMGHVTYMIESRHTYDWVMSHAWLSHVTRVEESYRTYEWAMLHIWTSRVTRVNESCHTHAWVYATHINESRYTSEWVMAHTCIGHVTHMNGSPCRTYERVMSHRNFARSSRAS